MNKKRIIYASICFVVTILSIVYLGAPRKLYGDPTGEVTFTFPDKIDFYSGERVWHCHVKQCARAYTQSELGVEYKDGDIYYCKDCEKKWNSLKEGTKEYGKLYLNVVKSKEDFVIKYGNKYDKFHLEVESEEDFILKDRSVGEKALLPDETPIRRRNYKANNGTQLTTTVVFSGIERGTIHRPQNCLKAAGGRISNEFNHTIKLNNGKELEVHIIRLSNTYTTISGEHEVVESIYAYWFFNPFVETSNHTTRFLYTLRDGFIFNYRPRWAYVSVAFNIDPNDPDRWKTILQDFIPRLYPYLEEYRVQERAKRWVETTLTPEETK